MANVGETKQARVLVVDDDEEARESLVEHLGRRGYRVHSAEDGRAAWNLLLNPDISYDLVITDLNMPVLDGLQLLQRIRERSLPIDVILWTGYMGHGALTKARELRVFAVLTKSHVLEELFQVVECALSRGAVA